MIKNLLKWMALIGLNMREDPGIEERDPDREWGAAAGGLRLSAKAREASLSLVLKNVSGAPLRTTIPGWLFFYRLKIVGPDGQVPRLTTFGQRALDASQNVRMTDLALATGQAIEAEIPVRSLWAMELRGVYRITASCSVGGEEIMSNEVATTART